MNPNASAWSPGGPVAPPAPPAPPQEIEVKPPAPAPVVSGEEGEGEDIDENDPLWIATLSVCEGDRERALKMLEDPDSLMQYPEIREIMERQEGEGEGEGDDWETTDATATEMGSMKIADEQVQVQVDTNTNTNTGSDSAAPSPKAKKPEAEEEEYEETAVALEDGDPREHLNLVFIGHVDAGKSTVRHTRTLYAYMSICHIQLHLYGTQTPYPHTYPLLHNTY
jgi:hypothetical protein